MTTVLLLGSTGFIGAHVQAALLRSKRVSRVVSAGRADLDLMYSSTTRITDYVTNTGADVLVDCTGRLDGSPSELLQIHAVATARLLEALAACNRRVRFVRLGSAGEYGQTRRGTSIREDDPARPVSAYGMSHLAATHLVRLAHRRMGTDAVSLRVFNPIGQGASGNSVLTRAAEQIRAARNEGRDSITLGNLDAWRDLVDVRDVANAVVAAVTMPGPLPPVLNIGSGSAIQMREAVELLCAAAGFTGTLHEEGIGTARSAGVDWTLANVNLAGHALGWHPRVTLHQSLRSVWADQLERQVAS
jgi:nucleoside-diphosphate-sugar epimerase